MSGKTPSDFGLNYDSIHRAQQGEVMTMELEPRYPLPGSIVPQGPAFPGNGIDQYGFKRYIRPDWGQLSTTVGPGKGSNFAGQYTFFPCAFNVADDVYGLQIGPNSEAFAVKIFSAGNEQPLIVTAQTPLIAPVKAPFWVSPFKVDAYLHTMELITYTRPPIQMFQERAPLFYQFNSPTANQIMYAPTYGRKNIKVTVCTSTTPVTISYHQWNAIDGLFNRSNISPFPFSQNPGLNQGQGDTVIASEVISNGFFTRDTLNSPNVFPSGGYDIFGVSGSANLTSVQIEAFD